MDLFRIHAPTAPYSDSSLVVVFDLLLHLLANLSSPTHPDFSRYFFVLESLVNTELAAVLCNRNQQCDAVLQQMFELFFTLTKVRNEADSTALASRDDAGIALSVCLVVLCCFLCSSPFSPCSSLSSPPPFPSPSLPLPLSSSTI